MKQKRFAVEQIVAIVKQAELGVPLAELIRQVGISEQTFYRNWNSQPQPFNWNATADVWLDKVPRCKELSEAAQ